MGGGEDMRYIPYKPPTTKIAGDEYEIMPTERSILIQRRMELGMTATQVAENANITLAQYQRFEMGKRNFTSASARMLRFFRYPRLLKTIKNMRNRKKIQGHIFRR